MRKVTFLIILCIFLLSPTIALGYEDHRFITVVNPVRIAPYTTDPVGALSSEYYVISKYGIPATWLLTYDSMAHEPSVLEIGKFDVTQELGIYLEVGKSLADAAGVEYDSSVAWHYPNNVFLSGYEQKDREKLIDTVFDKFESEFGYYPNSVGSWWTDSYSLKYMKDKYGITSNLTVADQYKTDNYQLWGQYWSVPFYPSIYHAGIPGGIDSQIDVLMLQWAPRDPLNGYYSSEYSTQDYHLGEAGQNIHYFERLIRDYLNQDNRVAHVTVGLEGDLSFDAYSGSEYERQIEVVKNIVDEENVVVATMSEFAKWHKENISENLSYFIDSQDLLGGVIQTFWYNSPKYRVGLFYDESKKNVELVDFRVYNDTIYEPYFTMPNGLLKLSIYIPSIVDKVRGDQAIIIDTGELIDILHNGDIVDLVFENGTIILHPDRFDVDFDNELRSLLGGLGIASIESGNNGTRIVPQQNWTSDNETVKYEDLTRDATYQLRRKRIRAYIGIVILTYLTIGIFVFYRSKSRVLLVGYIAFGLGMGFIVWNHWSDANSQLYSVHREEIYALNFLKHQPRGKVLVVDAECVGCKWYTDNVPAAFYNKRGYVEKYSGKPIVYSSEVFDAVDQESVKEAFEKMNADYIYLIRYGDYVEKFTFSPGDLGIEKIFENAYSEIWRVVEK